MNLKYEFLSFWNRIFKYSVQNIKFLSNWTPHVSCTQKAQVQKNTWHTLHIMNSIPKHVILVNLTQIFKYLVQNVMFCQTNVTRHISWTHFSNSSRVRVTKFQYHGYYSALFTAIHKYLHCDTHTCHKYILIFNIPCSA